MKFRVHICALLGTVVGLTSVAAIPVRADVSLRYKSNASFGTVYTKSTGVGSNPLQEISGYYNQVTDVQTFEGDFPNRVEGQQVVQSRIENTAASFGSYELQSTSDSRTTNYEVGVQYDHDFGLSVGY